MKNTIAETEKFSPHVLQLLFALTDRLGPFVAQKMEERFGKDWVVEARLALANDKLHGTNSASDLTSDPAVLFKLIRRRWVSVFRAAMPEKSLPSIQVLQNLRNACFHGRELKFSQIEQGFECANLILLGIGAATIAMEPKRERGNRLKSSKKATSSVHPPSAQRIPPAPRQPKDSSHKLKRCKACGAMNRLPTKKPGSKLVCGRCKADLGASGISVSKTVPKSPGTPVTTIAASLGITTLLTRKLLKDLFGVGTSSDTATVDPAVAYSLMRAELRVRGQLIRKRT
jgi:hypothetical protein